jgi:hypothetical protein
MTRMQVASLGGGVAFVMLPCFTGLFVNSPRIHAESGNTDSAVQIGFEIAPVPLNLNGKDRALVGKGSYLVNTRLCNNCHSSPDLNAPTGIWAPDHNPFFGQPKMVNPNGYLGGGAQFHGVPGLGPDRVSPLVVYARNLTPGCDSAPCTNPLPEGHSFSEFLTIMRTGHDFDNAHPPCPTIGVEGCTNPPNAGNLLQVMPWPQYGNMSNDDLLAVWTYLSAIPCISHAGITGFPPNIYQACP